MLASNAQHRAILREFEACSPARGHRQQRSEHLGLARRWYGLSNAQRRGILQRFCRAQPELAYAPWQALCTALYHGESYEERCAPQTLLRKYPGHRRRLPLSVLDTWLGCLEGWAEVDSTCQTVFSAQDMLADWPRWAAFLRALARDCNINKRRAALVLLTAPISQSPDKRILTLSLELIERLQSERDKRISKAVSWLLRRGIKQHRQEIAATLAAHGDSLPAVARRETRRKLETGKK